MGDLFWFQFVGPLKALSFHKAAGFQSEGLATPRAQPSTEKIGAEPRLAGPAFPCSQSKVALSQIQSSLPPNLFPRLPPAPGVQPKHLPEACTPFKWYPDCAPTSSLDILPCVLSTSIHPDVFFLQTQQDLSLSLSGPLTSYSAASANSFPVLTSNSQVEGYSFPSSPQCPTAAFVSWVKVLGSEDRTFPLNSRFAHKTEWEHKAFWPCARSLCTLGASSVFAECVKEQSVTLFPLLFTYT